MVLCGAAFHHKREGQRVRELGSKQKNNDLRKPQEKCSVNTSDSPPGNESLTCGEQS